MAGLVPDGVAPPGSVDVPLDDETSFTPPEQTVEVKLDDGSIVIHLGGEISQSVDDGLVEFNDNLATKLDDTALSAIASDLVLLIQADDQARSNWIAMRAEGIKLLGYEMKRPASGAGTSAGPIEGMSTIDHPLLAEAVDRFHSNAMCEMLPADGPVRVRVDGRPMPDEDVLGNALQKDMNHYLTTEASEYYPDTDYMLFNVGLGGCSFKKVYHHPIKRRPVSEAVDAQNLILSPDTVPMALESGARVTQRIQMRKPTLKRMQIVGAYRNIDIPTPGMTPTNAIDEEKTAVDGIEKNNNVDEKDRLYDIFECYCDLDIPGFEHRDDKGNVTGLPVPYKVVIERESQQVLEIRRNWNENDPLCLTKQTFVQYVYTTGIGPYGIGLAHKLANTVIAATAAWREGLDAGMFANFPGFLYAKGLSKQNTTSFRVPPGGGVPIDTQGLPINQAVMPLPYKEMGPGMMALTKEITDTGQRFGGVVEMTTGNGNSQAPVGTTLALIEQANIPQSAVHRRLCQAQGKEFQLLRDRFREDPEAFWRGNKRPAMQWKKDELLKALDNYDLVPAADPNTAGALQRAMRGQYLYGVAKENPAAFQQGAVYRYAMRSNGIDSPDSFLAPPPEPSEKDEDPLVKAAVMEAVAKIIAARTNEAKQKSEAEFKARQLAMDDANKDADRNVKVGEILLDASLEKGRPNVMAEPGAQQAAAGLLGSEADVSAAQPGPNGVN